MKHKTTKTKTFFKKLIVCVGHALLMMLISLLWLNLNYNIGVEKLFIQVSNIIKFGLTGNGKDYSNDFVFLDISKTKKLIPADKSAGVDVVTNRTKLDSFFRIVNRVSDNNYKYIVCDVLFDKPDIDDRKLQEIFDNTRKLMLPYSQNNGTLLLPVFRNTETGYVGYDVSSGVQSVPEFLKYQLIKNQTLKGLPVVLYENVNHATVEKFMGLAWVNGKPAFNNILINLRLNKNNSSAKILSFDETLDLLRANDSLFYNKLLANKIIVIGDYVNDMHVTALGDEPGSLLLADIYLSLLYNDNVITAGLFISILVLFSLLSWFFFYKKDFIKRVEEKFDKYPFGFVAEISVLTFLIWLISLFSYLCFGCYIDIVILVVYFTIFRYFIDFFENRKLAKATK